METKIEEDEDNMSYIWIDQVGVYISDDCRSRLADLLVQRLIYVRSLTSNVLPNLTCGTCKDMWYM
jgi:hypothetical protein